MSQDRMGTAQQAAFDVLDSVLENEVRWWWSVIFLSVGVLLVCCSGWLGRMIVQEFHGNGSYSWNPDKAREMAMTLRFLGAMCFAAGLCERLILHLAPSSKRDIH